MIWEFRFTSKKPGTSHGISANHRNLAYCEGCRDYVRVKSKRNINKGWRCTKCRSKVPVTAAG